MGGDVKNVRSGLATALLLLLGFLIMEFSDGFSIQVPASRLAGLGFERNMGDMTANKRYRQEVPLSALLQRSDLGRSGNIFKRTNSNAKPATCTCTCETKPVDQGSAAYKRVLSARNRRPSSNYEDYGTGYDQSGPHNVKKFNKAHHETPATCTCTCETHPTDEVAVSSSQVVGSKLQPSASQKGHKQQESDSIFWNDGEEYWGNGGSNNHGGWGEQPQSAALTSNNGQHEQDYGQEEDEKNEGGWGHTSRFPWKNLPDNICYRDRCDRDSDCCMRFNLCDRSAKVCVDCWYGASCEDESNCCQKYPICKTETYPAHNGIPGAVVVTGKCVDKL